MFIFTRSYVLRHSYSISLYHHNVLWELRSEFPWCSDLVFVLLCFSFPVASSYLHVLVPGALLSLMMLFVKHFVWLGEKKRKMVQKWCSSQNIYQSEKVTQFIKEETTFTVFVALTRNSSSSQVKKIHAINELTKLIKKKRTGIFVCIVLMIWSC